MMAWCALWALPIGRERYPRKKIRCAATDEVDMQVRNAIAGHLKPSSARARVRGKGKNVM